MNMNLLLRRAISEAAAQKRQHWLSWNAGMEWRKKKRKKKYVIFHFYSSILEWIQRIWIGLSKLCVWTRSPKVKNESNISGRCRYCFGLFFFSFFFCTAIDNFKFKVELYGIAFITYFDFFSSSSFIAFYIASKCEFHHFWFDFLCGVLGSSGVDSNGLVVANFAKYFSIFLKLTILIGFNLSAIHECMPSKHELRSYEPTCLLTPCTKLWTFISFYFSSCF